MIRGGEWELHIWYTAMGTRSEGQHGVLFHKGSRIQASVMGEELETSLGRMKHYEQKPGQMPWGPKGWNFADSSKILSCWDNPESK